METNCILQDILWKENTHLNTYWYLETSLPSLQGDAGKLGTINLFWESWNCPYKMEDRLWKVCLSIVRASSVSSCDNLNPSWLSASQGEAHMLLLKNLCFVYQVKLKETFFSILVFFFFPSTYRSEEAENEVAKWTVIF